MGWTTLWATFSQTHPVTLVGGKKQQQRKVFKMLSCFLLTYMKDNNGRFDILCADQRILQQSIGAEA
jgi:hypothetical protein